MARFANPFARARHDHAGETAKDYVELILEIEESGGTARTADLVKRLGVAQPTVTKSLDRLEREGLVTIEHRRGVQLTPEGQRMARESRTRHAIVLAFLYSLGVEPAQARFDAEGIEHHASAATIAAFERWIKNNGPGPS